MPANKSLDALKSEVKAIADNLDRLERQDLGLQIDALQESHQKLALKVSELKGRAAVIAIVFGLLLAIGGYDLVQDLRFQDALTKTNLAHAESNELMIDSFQTKIADTIDRIGLLDPSNEDKERVMELVTMQKRLNDLGLASPEFKNRSDLTNVLKTMVILEKTNEARDQLKLIKTSKDKFVAARALTLEAMAIILPHRYCTKPKEIKPLVEEAIEKDSGVSAAFNILGVCLTDEAKDLLTNHPERWQDSAQILNDAERNYELAFAIKPTPWSKARSLNNLIWLRVEFLFAAHKHHKLNESLPKIRYETMEDFFSDSLSQLAVCKRINPRQPGFWETEAELHGLKYAFYEEDADLRRQALAKMKEQLLESIDRGLYRRHPDREAAFESLRSDDLLQPLWPRHPSHTTQDLTTLDPEIRTQIERHLPRRPS